MPEPPEIVEGGTNRVDRDPPPSLGALLPRIVQQFDDEGALGVLLVDASPLAEIERQYGARAYRQAFGALAALVEELIGDQLLVTDLVVAGESGRDELAVLLFREPAEVDLSSTRSRRFSPGASPDAVTAWATPTPGPSRPPRWGLAPPCATR
jgi:hypothetical protein